MLGIVGGGAENKQVTIVDIDKTNQREGSVTNRTAEGRNITMALEHLNKRDAHC